MEEVFFRNTNSARVFLGNSLEIYPLWKNPQCIVSDGAYGIKGFDGDPSSPNLLAHWYEPHVRIWSERSGTHTTLWFWNTEVGWAHTHPLLESYGWKYVNSNVWNKGIGHIAGNIDTKKIRRFPVVTEICVQYVRDPQPIQSYLLSEWRRTSLPLSHANIACGYKNVATRKYFDQGDLWYWPPQEMYRKLRDYANTHGDPSGKPYFPISVEDYQDAKPRFTLPLGITNVWNHPPLRGGRSRKHPNQKPLDLLTRILLASTAPGDVIWEPFGGSFSTSLATLGLTPEGVGRSCYSAELNPEYYKTGVERLRTPHELREASPKKKILGKI